MARRLVDNNKRREHRRQVALLDRLTVQFRARLQREIATAMKDMVEMWLQTNQVTLPRGFYDRIESTYRQMALASITQFGLRILDQGKAHGLPLETKESFAQIMTRLALRYVQQEMIRRRITEVTETTRRQIVNAVDRGYRDGLGQRGVADAILDLVPSLSSTRANVIARTETHGAANYGSQEAAKQTGLPMKKEWLAAADERTRETHVIAGKQPPVSMDGMFKVGDAELAFPGDPDGGADYPEEVINCFHPDTLILGAGLQSAIRRDYSGQMIKMSLGGPINLTVTPNHPVLTDRGWILAGMVIEGDNLIYCGIGNHREIRASSDVNNRYATAQNLYDAGQDLRLVGGPSGVVVNFHGEMVAEQVNIVAFEGGLRNWFKSSGDQLFSQLGLAHADVIAGHLLADRMLSLSGSVPSNFSNSLMRRRSPSLASVIGEHGSGSPIALGDVRSRDIKFFQNCFDHSPGNLELFADGVGGVTSFKKIANKGVIGSSDLTPSFNNVSFERIKCTAIETFHYDGPVYNFESDTGLLISNGIVNHNCRCTLGYIIDDEALEAML